MPQIYPTCACDLPYCTGCATGARRDAEAKRAAEAKKDDKNGGDKK